MKRLLMLIFVASIATASYANNDVITILNDKMCERIIKDTEGLDDIKAIEAYEISPKDRNKEFYKRTIKDITTQNKKSKAYRELLKEIQGKNCYVDIENPQIKDIEAINLRQFLLLLQVSYGFNDLRNPYIGYRGYSEKQKYEAYENAKRHSEEIIEYSGVKRSRFITPPLRWSAHYEDVIVNAKLIKQRREQPQNKEEESYKEKIDKNTIRILCKYDESINWFKNATIYKCDKCKTGYKAKSKIELKELYPEGRKREYGIDKRHIDMMYNAGMEAQRNEHNQILDEILESGECKIIP